MSPFEFDTLILPSLFIFFITLSVTFLFTKWPALSILVAFLKSGFFIGYFGFLFDGTFTFLDDWTYLKGGKYLNSKDIGFSNLDENWQSAHNLAGGNHFIYYFQNAYSLRFFGNGYYAPVAINIALTAFIAFLGARLAIIRFGMSKFVSKLFFIYLFFHPDIFAWSNVMNGKDILVLLIHLLFLTAISIFLQRNYLIAFLILFIVTAFAAFLRFYIPFLFGISLFVALVLETERRMFTYFILTCSSILLYFLFGSWIYYAFNLVLDNVSNPIIGFLRMMLTPVPFGTEEKYSFLNFPAFFHWCFFPILIFGVFQVWRTKDIFSKFFVFYAILFIAIYAFFEDLQGPRHRVQLDYAIAVFQFIGFKVLITHKSSKV